jgi:hypothetical protein
MNINENKEIEAALPSGGASMNLDLQIQTIEALIEYREILAKREGLDHGDSSLPERSGEIQRLIWALDGDEENIQDIA